jgi:hypothetical protein
VSGDGVKGGGELEPNKTPAKNLALFYHIPSTAFSVVFEGKTRA